MNDKKNLKHLPEVFFLSWQTFQYQYRTIFLFSFQSFDSKQHGKNIESMIKCLTSKGIKNAESDSRGRSNGGHYKLHIQKSPPQVFRWGRLLFFDVYYLYSNLILEYLFKSFLRFPDTLFTAIHSICIYCCYRDSCLFFNLVLESGIVGSDN